MELTVANDVQNNLDQATINSFVSHLADTLSGVSTQRQEAKMIWLIQENFHQKAQRFLKRLELCLA